MELLRNDSFELGVPSLAPGQFASVKQPLDWTALPGSAPVEIVQSPYSGISSIHGTHWIDTQASPGGIDIEQTFNVPRTTTINQPVALTIKVAAAWEDIGGQTTNPNDVLQITVDGSLTQEINIHNFTDAHGNIDFNQFKTFTSTIQVEPGAHTIEIHDVGPASNVGIAVDAVSAVVSTSPVSMVSVVGTTLDHSHHIV
jgi:hypothetical protein